MFEGIESDQQCPHCEGCYPASHFIKGKKRCRKCRGNARGVKPAAVPWTAAEKAVIAQHYATGGLRVCRPLLPGRSDHSIQKCASRMQEAMLKVEGVTWPRVDAPIDRAFMAWRYPVEPVQLRWAA